jgi:hypothetical protein
MSNIADKSKPAESAPAQRKRPVWPGLILLIIGAAVLVAGLLMLRPVAGQDAPMPEWQLVKLAPLEKVTLTATGLTLVQQPATAPGDKQGDDYCPT